MRASTHNKEISAILAADIVSIMGVGDGTPYTIFETDSGKKHIVGRTIAYWSKQILIDDYYRVNRSTLIRKDQITEYANTHIVAFGKVFLIPRRKQII